MSRIRTLAGTVIYHPRVQNFIMAVIVLNAITLGMETSSAIMDRIGGLLYALDAIVLGIFVVEIALKLVAKDLHFFRDPWNVFDFIIVGIALIPAAGSLSALRSLRILRALRMISSFKRLRMIVQGMLSALPSIGWVTLLLLIVFYVFAVIGTNLFAARFPDWFGTLGASMYTLFQVMTLESWSMGIARPVMEVYPYAWAFFVPFIMLTTFIVLNVFIGVVVNAMAAIAEMQDHEAQEHALHPQSQQDRIAAQIEALETSLRELKTLVRHTDR